ncbi:MAG: flagellar hook assembly protein FlgD [Pseudohongiellaceae bacterium]
MSAIDAINSPVSGPAGRGAGGGGTAQELRDSFMTLLVTQLQNQDPLKPMENSQLTSQLAQINTVNGIDSLNDTLNGITSQIETGQSLQAAGLIDKGVLVPGNRLLVGDEGVATPFGVDLEKPASELNIRILSGDGQVVRRMTQGATDAGVESIHWDGRLDGNEVAPAGAYRVEIEALTEDGSVVESNALNYAVVSGISTGNEGGVRLDLGGISEQVRLQDVRQIL